MAVNHAAAAEFYITDHRGTVPGLGDRATLLLDGREMASSHHAIARAWAARHDFSHYRLFRGTIYEPNYTSALTPVRAAREHAR
jgi:hypothetical protein